MEKVSGQKYLYQRNGIYYFRVVIPARYRNYFQKSEIRESLATSNLRHATTKICKKIVEYNNRLEAIDKESQGAASTHLPPPRTNVTKSELDKIARTWFFEKQDREDIRLAAKRSDYSNILSVEKFKLELQKEAVGKLETKTLYAIWTVNELLEKNNINLEAQPELKDYFEDLINRGLLEIANENVDMLDGVMRGSHDGFFNLGKNLQHDQLYMDTMENLIDEYEADPGHNWADKTKISYSHQLRLIKEFFGAKTSLMEITRPRCQDFQKMIQQYPANATKKYGNVSYKAAIKKASSKGDKLLSVASQNSYLIKLSTLLEWAVKNDKMPRNTARGLTIADKTPDNKKRNSFSVNQLNIMFSSPLYTGSVDDERGYNRRGTSVTKRSRYWLPLLGLFTGARLNELAQLDVHDIKIDKNVFFIDINDDGEDKRLKTKNSARKVPIHPELIKMGLLKYVEQRKINNDEKLFPELDNKRTGLYSSKPSKLFAHWLKQIGAKESKTSYHSFRHAFRDALQRAEIINSIEDKLGGWATAGVKSRYGDGASIQELYNAISKVSYPGVNISHLYEK